VVVTNVGLCAVDIRANSATEFRQSGSSGLNLSSASSRIFAPREHATQAQSKPESEKTDASTTRPIGSRGQSRYVRARQHAAGYDKRKKPPQITVESPLSWLQIARYRDSQLPAKLAESVSTQAPTTIAAVLPYSILVTNTGSIPITGIAIRFDLTVNGKQSRAVGDFFCHSFGQAGQPLIPVNATRLFAPLKTSNPLAGGATSVRGEGGGVGPLHAPYEASALASLASGESLHISIDLAIAADGSSVGQTR
jgi:hypothetical protein